MRVQMQTSVVMFYRTLNSVILQMQIQMRASLVIIQQFLFTESISKDQIVKTNYAKNTSASSHFVQFPFSIQIAKSDPHII